MGYDIEKIINHLGKKFNNERLIEHGHGYNNKVFSYDDLSIKLIGSNIEGVMKDIKIREYISSEIPGFPVPKTVKFDDSKLLVPVPFLVMKRLGASNLKEYNKDSRKERILYDIGRLKARLNSIRSSSYGEIGSDLSLLSPSKNWKYKISDDFGSVLSKLKSRELIDGEIVSMLERFWVEYRSLLKHESSPCLCHGDTSASNILLSEDNSVCGLIDFEYANWGGALYDIFSSIRTKIITENPNQIIEGYSTISPITDRYEELIRIYQLLANMKRLKDVPKMAWRDISEQESQRRKEKIRLQCKSNIARLIS